MPHKPLQTYDRRMKRFVTASESKAVTAEGISNNNHMEGMLVYTKSDNKSGNNNESTDTESVGLNSEEPWGMVKYRRRKKKPAEIKCNKFNYRKGRTFEDFKKVYGRAS